MWWFYGLWVSAAVSFVVYMAYLTVAIYCENNNNRLTDWLYDKLGWFSKLVAYDTGAPIFLIFPLFMAIVSLAWPISLGATLLSLFYYFVVYNKAVKVLNKINSMMENK